MLNHSLYSRKIDGLILIIANISAVFFFITGDGNFLQIIWTYWLQSLIIGAVNVARILTYPLEYVNTIEVTQNGQPMNLPGKMAKIFLAGFFTFHYGIFHVTYAIFLFMFTFNPNITVQGSSTSLISLGSGSVSLIPILISGLFFTIYHFLMLGYEHTVKEYGNLKNQMLKPYARIIPLHLIIVIAPFVAARYNSPDLIFILFITLKAIMDMYQHIKQ